ncbi:MAG: sugar phosphate isomerase/epimerase [Chloroflexaceae bacterium]|nr:sugar phosphate isomerase/epimerase [Chloroflexaceae bacterium]NJL34496.1 sugar phosphate isomerase/epimerase [Chloroflexaceae bacterium]NJO04562.1 sugar phosphate isomerase/epimerase [Chloroflexaceae bacterium]
MQLGMMNDPRKDACAEARWAAEHGFEFLDLTIEGPAASLEQLAVPELHRILAESGLAVVGHTAWYLPFASPFAAVRRAAIESAAATFETFAQVGAAYVNVHLTFAPRLFPSELWLDWNGECFAELAERAEAYQLQVMVEHPPSGSIGVKEIGRVLDADKRLGFHLDVGHANVGGNKLEALLKAFGNRLVHVHMSDNHGNHDEHLPLGAGTIDYPKAIRMLRQSGYNDTITLEVFSADRDYLLLSAQKVRRWWAAAEHTDEP